MPTDFSETAEKALAQAVILAARSNVKLIVIHVVELNIYTMPAEMVTLGLMTEQLIDEAKEKMKTLVGKLKKDHKLKVEHANYIGNVYENIIRASHLFNADLIIMGTHGASGFREWLFGTNASHVVYKSPVPVLTIHKKSNISGFKRVVFPFNYNQLTLNKVEQVMALAIPFESAVFLLGFEDDSVKGNIATMLEHTYNISLKFSKAGIRCEYSLVEGENHAELILDHARKNKADLIAIVTMKDNNLLPVPGKEIIDHSEIPVLSVPAHPITKTENQMPIG